MSTAATAGNSPEKPYPRLGATVSLSLGAWRKLAPRGTRLGAWRRRRGPDKDSQRPEAAMAGGEAGKNG